MKTVILALLFVVSALPVASAQEPCVPEVEICVPPAPPLDTLCVLDEGGEFPTCYEDLLPPLTPEELLATICSEVPELPVCSGLPPVLPEGCAPETPEGCLPDPCDVGPVPVFCTPAPAADGFVASFTLPLSLQAANVPAILLTNDGVDVQVDALQLAGDDYVPYVGSLRLIVKGDCGGLEPVLDLVLTCPGTYDLFADEAATSSDGSFSFHLSAEDLAAAFELVPSQVVPLHFFVEAGDRTSHFLAGKEAVLALDAGQADLAEAITFSPVLLADGRDLPTPPVGDGLVASFDLPSVGGASAPLILLDEHGLDLTVHAQQRDADSYAPYAGDLRLIVQADCGSLEPILADLVACQPALEYLADAVASSEDGTFVFHIPAEDLSAAFTLLPVPAAPLHFFVEAGAQTSHYLTGNDVLAMLAPDIADALEDQTFSPVLVLDRSVVPNPLPQDGYTTGVRFTGAVPSGPGLLALPDAEGNVVIDVVAYHDHHATPQVLFEPYGGQQLDLVIAGRPGPDQAWDSGNPDITLALPLSHEGGGRYTATLRAADLPAAADGSLGFQVLVTDRLHDDDGGSLTQTHYSSFHFLAKEIGFLAADCFSDAKADGCAQAAQLADLLDTKEPDSEGRLFTPVFFEVPVASAALGDGMVARILPLNSFRTPAGAVMELDSANQFVFDVCAFDDTGAPYDFTDFRLEFYGLPRDPAATEPTTIFAAGTYNLPQASAQLAPNEQGNCNRIGFNGAYLMGDGQLDRLVQVGFWVPYAQTGRTARYSETVNALIDGADPDDFALANQVDIATASGLDLLGRRMSPIGTGDASTSALLDDPASVAGVIAGAVTNLLPDPPEECPAPTVGTFPECGPDPETLPDECPDGTTGEFPACEPDLSGLPDECPDGTTGEFPACIPDAPGADCPPFTAGEFPECTPDLGDFPPECVADPPTCLPPPAPLEPQDLKRDRVWSGLIQDARERLGTIFPFLSFLP